MKIYDMMAGKLGLGKSVIISKKETEKLIPNVNKKDLEVELSITMDNLMILGWPSL